MTIIDLKTMREASPPPFSALCLGNFDGVHQGHRALIEETLIRKRALEASHPGIVSGACFFRHPPAELLSGITIPQLSTMEQKLSLFAAAGLEYAFVMDFEQVGGLAPEDFVQEILKKEFHCIFAVCGFNFHFGRTASGDAESLCKLMDDAAAVVPPIRYETEAVSSSTIRQKIADGKMDEAARLLGRPYAVTSTVLHGKALGRTIGIPTINQDFPGNMTIPRLGIYITSAEVDKKMYPSISNVGSRPTVDHDNRINCETHILNYSGDLYGRSVTVRFFKRIRDEIRFHDLDALKRQIQLDIVAARTFFEEVSAL